MTAFIHSSQDMFGPGPFGTHAYAAATSGVAGPSSSVAPGGGSSGGGGGSLRRPSSPPQPVPRRSRQATAGPSQQQLFSSGGSGSSLGGGEWYGGTHVSGSPARSDATEQFLDCHSEGPSGSNSFDVERGGHLGDCHFNPAPPTPRYCAANTLAAAAAAVASGAAANGRARSSASGVSGVSSSCGDTGSWVLQQERQQRLAADSVAVGMRRQLDDISAMLFSYRRGQQQQEQQQQAQQQQGAEAAPTPPPLLLSPAATANLGLAAELRVVLQEATAAQQQLATAQASAAAAADGVMVARLVAGMCARAAAVADLGAQWQSEKAVLERRLEQAARMGQAMLKHQKENNAEPEPWRQQLLNTSVSVGCSMLGAAAAVLIIRHSQGA